MYRHVPVSLLCQGRLILTSRLAPVPVPPLPSTHLRTVSIPARGRTNHHMGRGARLEGVQGSRTDQSLPHWFDSRSELVRKV